MHTYQLGAPMSWKEFKALPDDLKCVYVLKLREKFNVNAVKLAEMFGVGEGYLRGIIRELGLGEKTHRNMSAAQVEAWEAFWKDGAEETSAELETPEECEEEEVVIELPKAEEKKNAGCAINSGTVVFKGKAPDIAIALMKFLGDNEYTISVAFSAVAED